MDFVKNKGELSKMLKIKELELSNIESSNEKSGSSFLKSDNKIH